MYHQLASTGNWRVTDAPVGWQDDGRDYPEAKASDRFFDNEEDARSEWLARLNPPEREDFSD